MSDNRPWDFWIDVRHDKKAGVTVAYFANWTNSPTGVAKCMPEDTFDEELGAQLAVGRLLSQMGKQLEVDAFNEVHYRDLQREKRELAAAEALLRKRARSHDFQCRFAELINAVQAAEKEEKELKLMNDTVPDKKYASTTPFKNPEVTKSLDRIRKNLPA